MSNAVININRLGTPPWPTSDPFLFCVHHVDDYPAGNEAMGPAASLAGRRLGQDFEGRDGWLTSAGPAPTGLSILADAAVRPSI